jgi:hypothetical protein
MTDSGKATVPVWTLTTSGTARIPALLERSETISAKRLSELRSALATFADSPLVTLEAHPMPKQLDRTAGIPLDAVSPLAQHLSNLVTRTAQAAPAVNNVVVPQGEALFKMVVPAKLAADMGKGLVKPMIAKGMNGAIRGSLVGPKGIVGQAAFTPVVAEAATAGALGGAAGTAGVAAAGAGILTVAAPLVLMAVAVGVSAYADNQRQQAIENVTELLEKLHSDKLDAERAELNGCQDAIDKATSILLDHGRVGVALGLDSAVHEIDTAAARARDRLKRWQASLDALPDGTVSLDQLTSAFPGVAGDGGEFRTHLELAALAIALKRRVIVLQAVDQSQSDTTNPFENFVKSLKRDQSRVDDLEAGIASVLTQLSAMHLRAPARLRQTLMPRADVDELMRASYRLRDLADDVDQIGATPDVVIQIARHEDGSLLVLPAAVA